jgi:hypothetical protein
LAYLEVLGLDQATDCLRSAGGYWPVSTPRGPILNLLSAMMTNVEGDWVSELEPSMSTRQKRSTAALETSLLFLFRNTRDLELQLHELNKLRYQVRQAELSVRKSRRTDSEVRERLGNGQGHAALSRPRSQR